MSEESTHNTQSRESNEKKRNFPLSFKIGVQISKIYELFLKISKIVIILMTIIGFLIIGLVLISLLISDFNAALLFFFVTIGVYVLIGVFAIFGFFTFKHVFMRFIYFCYGFGVLKTSLNTECVNNRLEVLEKHSNRDSAHWEPSIELSFIFLATFLTLSRILNLDSYISFFLGIIIAVYITMSFWVFEDLNIDLGSNDLTFGLVKKMIFSKKSLKIVSLVPLIKTLLENQSFYDQFILSITLQIIGYDHPIIRIFGGIFSVIFVLYFILALFSVFVYVFLQIVKGEYSRILIDLNVTIPKKINNLVNKLDRNNSTA